MSDYYDETLTMGQRIMNHKFAKMSIWEFLGWSPKKSQEIAHKEAEDERWRKKEERDQYFIDLEQMRFRTTEEWNKIRMYRESCSKVMFMISNEFASNPEWDKAWKSWVLDESASAYLPLCYGEVMKKMKADNKYLPSTHMVLI